SASFFLTMLSLPTLSQPLSTLFPYTTLFRSIVDTFTGRLMKGSRYSDGLHQAIEAKEGLKIQNESMTLASITFQNYFRMYNKLAGMTGTAKTEEEEFRNIYNMDVIAIPTNKPIAREDRPDMIYKTMEGKFNAVIEAIH